MYITDTFPYQMLSSAIGIAGILLVAIICRKIVPWSKQDRMIGLGSIALMAVAFVLGQTAFWVLMASMVVLTFGSWATFKKIYTQPYSEPLFPWTMSWTASLLQTLSASQSSFEARGVSLWIMLFVTVIIGMILIRRRYVPHAAVA
jgi:hypothetical protein